MATLSSPINKEQTIARSLGYTGEFGGGKAADWLKTSGNLGKYETAMKAPDAPGIQPLTVSSQNKYQQESLYDMGKQSAPIDSRIGASYDRAAQPFDTSKISNFLNPYIDEVINKNAASTRRSFDVVRNGIDEQMARAGGFGSTAQGVERGMANEAQERQIGEMDANLRSQGYNNAVLNALGLYNNDANRAITLGNNYQNLDQYGRNVLATDQDRKLAAGDRIQSQNQRELDAYYAEVDRLLNYPRQQTDFLGKVLNMYPTGQTNTSSTSGNRAQSALGGGLLGYSLMNQPANGFVANPHVDYSGVQGGSLPWLNY